MEGYISEHSDDEKSRSSHRDNKNGFNIFCLIQRSERLEITCKDERLESRVDNIRLQMLEALEENELDRISDIRNGITIKILISGRENINFC